MCTMGTFTFLVSCALFLCLESTQVYSSRSYVNQQNTQTLLNSIDERLRNLDKSSTYRHANAVDQHMRKLEALEAKIERFESILSTRLDKIEANMSMQHFKDDLVQDQLIRKIDSVYERLHHKMFHIEMKIDANEKKMTEKLESMAKKFEHLDENANRRSEADEEVAEVFDVLDEMKTTLHAGIENVTQFVYQKITELETKLPPKTVFAHVQRLESILNSTRYEQQNSMRTLVVMVGRLGGKNNNNNCPNNYNEIDNASASSEPGTLSQQLTNVSRKIDAQFDMLMEQQTVFADSCHRIQSDEPQLESKISEILEKIIDVFEKESAVEIKDIQNIEQLIKSHDTSVRRSLYTTSHNMAVLLQKAKEHKDDLALQVAAVRASVDGLSNIISTINDDDADASSTRNNITKLIQDLRSDLLASGNVSQVQVQTLLDDLRSIVSVLSSNYNTAANESGSSGGNSNEGSIDKNNIKIIGEELRNVSGKIDALVQHLDVDKLYKRIELLLMQYEDNRQLDAAIRQVFGNTTSEIFTAQGNSLISPSVTSAQPSNTAFTAVTDVLTAATSNDGIIFDEIYNINCTSGLLDVRMPSENCTMCNTTTQNNEKTNEEQPTTQRCCCPPTNSTETIDVISFPDDAKTSDDQFVIDLRVENEAKTNSTLDNVNSQKTKDVKDQLQSH